MVKKFYFIILVLILLIINLQFINGTVYIGNKSYFLETDYSQSQPLKGWINVSFDKEPSNNSFTCLGKNISIIDFLDLNKGSSSYFYSCYPSDCNSGYQTTGSEANSKTLNINVMTSKIVGIRLTGDISSVNSILFNISTNAQESCSNPIQIDILADGIIEWISKNVSSNSFCYIEKPYGCFEYSSPSTTALLQENYLYCEKIRVPPTRGFVIGARLNGSGVGVYKMTMTAFSQKDCLVTAKGDGNVECKVEFNDIDKYIDASICITPENINGSSYSIKYEDVSPCGYIKPGSDQQFSHDLEIYARPLKYSAPPSNFKFDQFLVGNDINLASDITNYISRRYENNCSPECVIPIKIISGTDQTTTISSLYMSYDEGGASKSTDKLYDIITLNPFVSTPTYRKLDLEKANFIIPSTSGNVDVILKIGNLEIFRNNITTKKIPVVYAIAPTSVPALVPTDFFAFTEGSPSNLTYKWKFGNESERITSTNTIEYTFSNTGEYPLTVKVANSKGESSKTVNIKVLPPSEGINKTIKEYKLILNNLSLQIGALSPLVQDKIKAKVNVEDLRNQVNSIEKKYKESSSDEFVKILNNLISLRIPKEIRVVERISPTIYFQSQEQIIAENFEKIGIGTIDESERENYFNDVNSWLLKKVNISFQSKTYAAYYGSGQQELLFSDAKISITPLEDIDELYVIINGDNTKIFFDPQNTFKIADVGEDAVGITFEEMVSGEKKEIEFLYPDKMEITNLPIFISPPLDDVPTSGNDTVSPCNHDKVCDKDKGEDWKNCRDDCKPWHLTLTFLAILLGIALIIYIGLQEWYKRHYESHLFSSKTQLFNLINFMNNCVNQGLQKKEVFYKLKDFSWSNEQLEFAWRKFKGQRTGMWEIPVFKWVENREVKRELEKRKSSNI